jgi:hypothetical protein
MLDLDSGLPIAPRIRARRGKDGIRKAINRSEGSELDREGNELPTHDSADYLADRRRAELAL